MHLGLPSWVTWQVILLYWLATVSGSWWAWLVFIPMGYELVHCFMVWSKPQIAGRRKTQLCHVGFTSYWQHMSEECWKTSKVIVAYYSTPLSYMIITNLHLRDHSSYPRILPSFFAVLKCLYVFSCVFPSNMPRSSCCLAEASGCPKGESTWRDIPFKES